MESGGGSEFRYRKGFSMRVTAEQKKLLDARWSAYGAGRIARISLPELKRRRARKRRPESDVDLKVRRRP
jgi:hypothetical protein